MTHLQLYKKVKSLAWRRKLSENLEEIESDIKGYMFDKTKNQIVVAGYSLKLIKEKLVLEELPFNDARQIEFDFSGKNRASIKSIPKNYFGHEVKIQLVRETVQVNEYLIKTPTDAYELVKDELSILDREAFIVIALSTKNKVLGLNIVSIGSLSSSLVHPREVFKSAILMNSASIFLLHNHPSGETQPSKDDIEITHRLVAAGNLIGIKVIDHLIIGNTFFSFRENRLLKQN